MVSLKGLILLVVLINDIDSVTDYVLNKLENDIRLNGAVNMLGGRNAIQKDLDRLEIQQGQIQSESPSENLRESNPKYQ